MLVHQNRRLAVQGLASFIRIRALLAEILCIIPRQPSELAFRQHCLLVSVRDQNVNVEPFQIDP